MKTYHVYYMKPESFWELLRGDVLPTVKDLENTHTYLRSVEAEDLEGVFYRSQGEVWSPNGEANALIRVKGLRHTSMSVGDVVQEDGVYYAVAGCGFKELE